MYQPINKKLSAILRHHINMCLEGEASGRKPFSIFTPKFHFLPADMVCGFFAQICSTEERKIIVDVPCLCRVREGYSIPDLSGDRDGVILIEDAFDTSSWKNLSDGGIIETLFAPSLDGVPEAEFGRGHLCVALPPKEAELLLSFVLEERLGVLSEEDAAEMDVEHSYGREEPPSAQPNMVN